MTRRLLLKGLLASVPRDAVCWIELDLPSKTKKVLWPDASRPIGYGSLLKPFLTLAYAATHSGFPTFVCNGVRDRCWLAKGHGQQNITSALANSCNLYFLRLTQQIDRAALDQTCLTYGLNPPARSLSDDALIGLGSGWRNTPLDVVQAFSRLTDTTVLRGLAQCAISGTAKNLQIPCYAKTGTAPCSHTPHAAGDGFVAILYPIDQPRKAILLQHHGTTGAEACRDVRARVNFL